MVIYKVEMTAIHCPKSMKFATGYLMGDGKEDDENAMPGAEG